VKKLISHPEFYSGQVDTSFIDSHPEFMLFDEESDTRLQRLLQFLGEMAVNGNTALNPTEKCIEY
jgi:pyruvate carboxylase